MKGVSKAESDCVGVGRRANFNALFSNGLQAYPQPP